MVFLNWCLGGCVHLRLMDQAALSASQGPVLKPSTRRVNALNRCATLHRRQPGLAGNNLDSDMAVIVSIAQNSGMLLDRIQLPPKLESHRLKPLAFSVNWSSRRRNVGHVRCGCAAYRPWTWLLSVWFKSYRIRKSEPLGCHLPLHGA